MFSTRCLVGGRLSILRCPALDRGEVRAPRCGLLKLLNPGLLGGAPGSADELSCATGKSFLALIGDLDPQRPRPAGTGFAPSDRPDRPGFDPESGRQWAQPRRIARGERVETNVAPYARFPGPRPRLIWNSVRTLSLIH